MSDDAGDAAARLSDALEHILTGGEGDRSERVDEDLADDADAPYELPTIVQATDHDPLPDPAGASGVGDEQSPTGLAPTLETGPTVPPASESPAAPPAAPAVAAPAAPSTAAVAEGATRLPPAAEVAQPARATGWGPEPASGLVTPVTSQLRAPGRRPRVRRVTRVLRHIDPWSTFKIALVFSCIAYVVTLTSGVLLWRVADSTGTLANIERWFTQFGWETFELKGGEIFHNAWIIGLFGVVATTGGAVLLVTLFNLVSDIVGGIRMTVLEEEVVERTVSSTRRYVVRSAKPGATAPAAIADWSVDDPADDRPPPTADEDTAPDADASAGTASGPEWSVD